VSGQVEP
jgi:hypothetical protein